MIQGRSLIYRFAAAAPFWIGVMAEVPSLSAGRLRHAAGRIVGHFAENGAPDDGRPPHDGLAPRVARPRAVLLGPGLAVLGGQGTDRHLASGRPSGLGRRVRALPVEAGDTLRAVRSAGWIVSGTHDDGIVRLVNHGTDHAAEGVTSVIAFSFAGERMPWLTYHMAWPMILFTGWVMGVFIDGLVKQWTISEKPGRMVLSILVLTVFILALLIQSAPYLVRHLPFQGTDLVQLQATGLLPGSAGVRNLIRRAAWLSYEG